MSQNSSLKQTESNYGQNVVCSDNPGQTISHKVKKSSKIGQDFKICYLILCVFLTAIVSLISGRKTGY